MLVKPYIKKLSLTVAYLEKADLEDFLNRWLLEVKDNKEIMEIIYTSVIKAFYPAPKCEVWMERRLSADITLTPKRLSYECRHYFHLPPELKPYLIRLARKVKDRLRKRQKCSE